jgi:hypothetical protein
MSRTTRKAVAPTQIIDPDLDQDRIENAVAVMRQTEEARALDISQREAAVRAVATRLGYQLPADSTDPDLIQRDIATNIRRSVETCLEMGRGLCVLKEACGHGQFVARLDVLGIDKHVASRFMQAAAKFAKLPTSATLPKAIASQSKLFEMLVLDDEQIEELELTGQTGELKLDDIATMSVKELRAALRETRAEITAKEELLADKNKALDAERAKSKRIAAAPPDEVLADLQAETTRIYNTVLSYLRGDLRQAVLALNNHTETHEDMTPIHFVGGLVGQLQDELNTLRDEFGLPEITDEAREFLLAQEAADESGADLGTH